MVSVNIRPAKRVTLPYPPEVPTPKFEKGDSSRIVRGKMQVAQDGYRIADMARTPGYGQETWLPFQHGWDWTEVKGKGPDLLTKFHLVHPDEDLLDRRTTEVLIELPGFSGYLRQIYGSGSIMKVGPHDVVSGYDAAASGLFNSDKGFRLLWPVPPKGEKAPTFADFRKTAEADTTAWLDSLPELEQAYKRARGFVEKLTLDANPDELLGEDKRTKSSSHYLANAFMDALRGYAKEVAEGGDDTLRFSVRLPHYESLSRWENERSPKANLVFTLDEHPYRGFGTEAHYAPSQSLVMMGLPVTIAKG